MTDAALADREQVPAPPQGYAVAEGRGPYADHNGPYFIKSGDEPLVEQAFYALKRHTNPLGLVHGGMLSGFLDGMLAVAVRRGAGRPGVTIHLSIDFMSAAREGEWVFGEAKVTRATRDVAFAEARAFVGDKDIVRVTAVFKLINP